MKNTILVVGSVALDSVKTVYGRTERALGGSAVHFHVRRIRAGKLVEGERFSGAFRRL